MKQPFFLLYGFSARDRKELVQPLGSGGPASVLPHQAEGPGLAEEPRLPRGRMERRLLPAAGRPHPCRSHRPRVRQVSVCVCVSLHIFILLLVLVSAHKPLASLSQDLLPPHPSATNRPGDPHLQTVWWRQRLTGAQDSRRPGRQRWVYVSYFTLLKITNRLCS